MVSQRPEGGTFVYTTQCRCTLIHDSVSILAYPVLTFVTIVLIIGVVLFVVGIERILQGIVAPGKSRWGTMQGIFSVEDISEIISIRIF